MINEENRERLSDEQLSALLKKWIVAAPPGLEQRVMGAHRRRSWWRFLLQGSIRVPVPVACCLAVLLIVIVWRTTTVAAPCVGANVAIQAAGARAAHAVGVCPANSKC